MGEWTGALRGQWTGAWWVVGSWGEWTGTGVSGQIQG